MAATRLIALHINKGKTVLIILRMQQRRKMENTSARMPVMQRPVMKNFCFPNGSMSISREEPRRMM